MFGFALKSNSYDIFH